MAADRPEKPSSGSWTQVFPQLGTGDLCFEDSISDEWFRKEKEAIFKRSWICIGRTTELPKAGSYFTKELSCADTSVLVVRGKDNAIRAFHNMCSHRGNKLVWQDDPSWETRGVCRQFHCRFHAWQFGLDGALLTVTGEKEFFGLDKSKLGLSPLACDVWAGFIFVNVDPEPLQSLKDFLGDTGQALKEFPFDKMTQTYAVESIINANWKVFSDSFSENYHSPFLHGQMSPEMAEGSISADLAFANIMPPHGMVSYLVVPETLESQTAMEKATNSGLFGPRNPPDVGGYPATINPAKNPDWGADEYHIFPNMAMFLFKGNWFLTFHFYPITVDTHRFEIRMYFPPPKTLSERLAQEMTVITAREYAFQDASTLEATQSMLKSRVKTHFPISDQEIMVRRMHHYVREAVTAYETALVNRSGVR